MNFVCPWCGHNNPGVSLSWQPRVSCCLRPVGYQRKPVKGETDVQLIRAPTPPPQEDPEGAEIDRRLKALQLFTDAMREKLLSPRCVAKGDWNQDSITQVFLRLVSERMELDEAFLAMGRSPSDCAAILGEAVDVALTAMQLADKCCGGLR